MMCQVYLKNTMCVCARTRVCASSYYMYMLEMCVCVSVCMNTVGGGTIAVSPPWPHPPPTSGRTALRSPLLVQ